MIKKIALIVILMSALVVQAVGADMAISLSTSFNKVAPADASIEANIKLGSRAGCNQIIRSDAVASMNCKDCVEPVDIKDCQSSSLDCQHCSSCTMSPMSPALIDLSVFVALVTDSPYRPIDQQNMVHGRLSQILRPPRS